MNQYYLGLLLKYEAIEKYRFRDSSLTYGFHYVEFPKVKKVFANLSVNELIGIKFKNDK